MKKIIGFLIVAATVAFACPGARAEDCAGIGTLDYLRCLTGQANALYDSLFASIQGAIDLNYENNIKVKAAELKQQYADDPTNSAAANALAAAAESFWTARSRLSSLLLSQQALSAMNTADAKSATSAAAQSAGAAVQAANGDGIAQDIKSLANEIKNNADKLSTAVAAIENAKAAYAPADNALKAAEAEFAKPNPDPIVFQDKVDEASPLAETAFTSIDAAARAIALTQLPSRDFTNFGTTLINRAGDLRNKVGKMIEAALANGTAEEKAAAVAQMANPIDAIKMAKEVAAALLTVNATDPNAALIQNEAGRVEAAANRLARDIEEGILKTQPQDGEDGVRNLIIVMVAKIDRIAEPADKPIVKTTFAGLNRHIDTLNELVDKINVLLRNLDLLKAALNDANRSLENMDPETVLALSSDGRRTNREVLYSNASKVQSTWENANNLAGGLLNAANQTGISPSKNGFLTTLGLIDPNRFMSALTELDRRTSTFRQDSHIRTVLNDIKGLVDNMLNNATLVCQGEDVSMSRIYEIKTEVDALDANALNIPGSQSLKDEVRAEKTKAYTYVDLAEACAEGKAKLENLNAAIESNDMGGIKTAAAEIRTAITNINAKATATRRTFNRINIVNTLTGALEQPIVAVATMTPPTRYPDRINAIRGAAAISGDAFKHRGASNAKRFYSETPCNGICGYNAFGGWTFCGDCAANPEGSKNTICTADGAEPITENGSAHNYSIYKCLIIAP